MGKNFGMTGLLLFIGLIAVVLVATYMFINNFLVLLKPVSKSSTVHNYKNAYTVYMKEHNITYTK